MKCTTPKRLIIKNNNSQYNIYVPCGKCYACQCQSRAEWALRCAYELKDTKGSICFLTFTYDNNYLPHTCNDRIFKHLVIIEEFKRQSERRWNFSRLNPEHATKLIRTMQRYLKKEFNDKSLLFRYFLTGEYGDLTNRSHMHMLLFCPLPFTLSDFQKFFDKIWKYGNVDIELPENSFAVINYLAKHQVKSCEGCDEQKKESPIFKRVSRYGGGLGRTMKNDLELRYRFFDDEQDNYISVQKILHTKVDYKMSYPRFLRKHYITRTLEEYELNYLSQTSEERFKDMITNKVFESPALIVPGDWTSTVANVIKYNRTNDFKLRQKYEKKRLLKKVNSFVVSKKRSILDN